MISNFYLRFYKYRKIIFATLIASYTFIFSFIFHENWMDETQAWLIVRDSHNLAALVHNLRYEGHPLLWYLLLYLPSHMNGSIYWMKFINAIIVFFICHLFVSHSPFNRIIKILFCVSFYPFYEYGIISRSYLLGFLCLFIIAKFSSAKKRNLLLISIVFIFLCQTDLLAILASSVIIFYVFANEVMGALRSKIEKNYLLMASAVFFLVLGLVLFLAVVIPPFDSFPAVSGGSGLSAQLLHNINNSFLPLSRYVITRLEENQFTAILLLSAIYYFSLSLIRNRDGVYRLIQKGGGSVHSGWMLLPSTFLFFSLLSYFFNLETGLSILLLTASAYTLRRNFIALVSYFLGIALIEAFFALLYSAQDQHMGFIFVTYILILWITGEKGKYRKFGRINFYETYGFLFCVLLVQVFASLYMLFADARYNYSNTREVANYITSNNLSKGYAWFMGDCYGVRGVLGYVNHDAFFADNTMSRNQFETWNLNRSENISNKLLIGEIYKYQESNKERLLILSCRKINDSNLIKLESFNKKTIKPGEGSLYLYVYN